MLFLKWACILIPLIILCLYVKNTIKPFGLTKLSNVNKNRLYYSASMLWYYIFCFVFYEDIIRLKLFNNYNNGTTQSIYNYLVITFFFIITSITINIILFKNLSVSKLNIRGVELNVNEIDELAKSAIIRKENYELLCHVFLVQYEAMANIVDYINNLTSIKEESIYVDLLKYYERLREDINIKCYYYTRDGMLNLKEYNEISDEEFSTIQYSLDLNGVCIPPQDEIKLIYAKIVTSFVFPDIVIKIQGDKLFEQEHLAIQNIISSFDKELIINSEEQ